MNPRSVPRSKISSKTDKPKSSFAVIIRLGKYLLHYKWLLILAIFLSISSSFFSSIGPFLAGRAVDVISSGIVEGQPTNINFNGILFYVNLMIIFYVFSSIAAYILSIIMIKMSQNVIYKMRKDVFNKLVKLPTDFFDKNQTGDILSKISYDIDTINMSLSTDVVTIFSSLVTIIIALVMMIIISPILILVFVVTIPISFFYTRFMAKKTKPLFRKRSISLGKLNGNVEEMITGSKTIRAYNREKIIVNRFDEYNNKAVLSTYNAEYYSSLAGTTVNFINNISLSLISLFGAIIYLGKYAFLGVISLGNITSFVLYSRKFSGPINQIANIISELQSALAASERVLNLIDETEEDESQVINKIINIYGEVSFDNINFSYKKETPIIKNLTLNVKKGELVAIVGPTGAGKTTLINLLMRFYDVDNGIIYLDNQKINTIKRKQLRTSYAMVLQDTWLFNGTIYDNITYGKRDATLEEVYEASKVAMIHDFIMHLPDGYNTILSEDGINISKGQKQLLTIARAMLMDSKMLILDEATSNVDSQTELAIQNAMLNLMENKTCFVIAHRLSTIKNANKIIVFNNGEIKETGSHKELIDLKGIYYDMYTSQF